MVKDMYGFQFSKIKPLHLIPTWISSQLTAGNSAISMANVSVRKFLRLSNATKDNVGVYARRYDQTTVSIRSDRLYFMLSHMLRTLNKKQCILLILHLSPPYKGIYLHTKKKTKAKYNFIAIFIINKLK